MKQESLEKKAREEVEQHLKSQDSIEYLRAFKRGLQRNYGLTPEKMNNYNLLANQRIKQLRRLGEY